MKFAITGGSGFIGSHLAKHLIENDHNVVIIDNLHTGKKENLSGIIDKIEFFKMDIRNLSEMESVLKSVDGIFHQAALADVQESFANPQEYHDVNVIGTQNVFEIAKKYNCKVVFASSSSVYGNTTSIPIKERYDTKPINPYGQTKLDDETLARQYFSKGLKVIGLRYFNVFGKGQSATYAGVITKFLNALNNNESPKINGDGKQVRDFVHVTDISRANLMAMLSDVSSGFFNVGTGKTTSITELADIMIEIYGLKLRPVFQAALEGDALKSQSDSTSIKEKIGWSFTVELRDGLKKLVQSC